MMEQRKLINPSLCPKRQGLQLEKFSLAVLGKVFEDEDNYIVEELHREHM